MPRDYVCKTGDICRELYYCSKGVVEILGEGEGPVDPDSGNTALKHRQTDRQTERERESVCSDAPVAAALSLVSQLSRGALVCVCVCVCAGEVILTQETVGAFFGQKANTSLSLSLSLSLGFSRPLSLGLSVRICSGLCSCLGELSILVDFRRSNSIRAVTFVELHVLAKEVRCIVVSTILLSGFVCLSCLVSYALSCKHNTTE